MEYYFIHFYILLCRHILLSICGRQPVGGKLKLKNNAVPTIFPSNVEPSKTVSSHNNDGNMSEMDIKIDHWINTEDVEANQQLELENVENTAAEERVNENSTPEDHINDCTIPEKYQIEMINKKILAEDHLSEQNKEDLEKQCDNLKNLLEKYRQKCKSLEHHIKKRDKQLSKIIKTSRQYKGMIKKCLKKAREEFQTCKKIKTMISKVFNEDQVKALCTPNKRVLWSNATIQRAIRLKLACGSNGYQEILRQNIPLPSERTLRRNMEAVKFKEGICNIFEILSNKINTFTDEKDKDCMLAIDEMSITSGTVLDQSTQTYCGYATLPDNKGK